jgi:drug/metabolite transporter (DMT)-like permease
LLFGVAGLFGKLLHVQPAMIVFGRTLFASLFLLVVLGVLKTDLRVKNGRHLLGFACMGAILAVHWTSFFYSVQISTVAIALLTYSSFPIFVTFLEPFAFGERMRLLDIVVSFAVFIGLVMIIPEFNLANNLTQGVLWGTFSGFTFAVLSILNRKFVAEYSALTVALYQDGFACLMLLPFIGSTVVTLSAGEWGWLILLGVVFTALAHSLFIWGMRSVKAQLAGMIACLEPVYGILFALVLLQEIPSAREIMGGAVIIGSIVYATKNASVPGVK